MPPWYVVFYWCTLSVGLLLVGLIYVIPYETLFFCVKYLMKKVIDAAQGTPEDHRYHGGLFHAPFARDILTRIYILEAIR